MAGGGTAARTVSRHDMITEQANNKVQINATQMDATPQENTTS